MELKIVNGDYVLCGGGGFQRLYGAEAVLHRILFKLSARRGQFPLIPELGSDLWRLPVQPKARRESAAWSAVTAALVGEPVTVKSVTVGGENRRLRVSAELDYMGESLTAEVTAR